MKLFVATHNKHKLREIAQILPGFEIVPDNPEGIEENAPDFEGNALIKVRAIASRHPGEWCMADDSGLEVNALGGAPGVRSARYAGEEGNTPANNALLLKNLEGVEDRRANFNCTIALVSPDGCEHVCEGKVFGKIASSPSGVEGFGYDPLFIPAGFDKSFAELSSDAKNAISHRGRALEKVKGIIAPAKKKSGAFLAYLKLFRAVNIPTVPGDVLVGAAAALAATGAISGVKAAAAAAASVCLYLFGLVDNDIVGAAKKNSLRPIPAGEISLGAARVARGVTWALALLLASRFGFSVEWWIASSALLVGIVVYNRTKLSALMGLCRGLNVLMGALAVIPSPSGDLRLFAYAGIPAAVWFVYITAVTQYAKHEDSIPGRRAVVGLLISALVYFQLVALLFFSLSYPSLLMQKFLLSGAIILVVLRLCKKFMPKVSAS
ncbi:MAG: RdgB/HAM1 family non-canonical purine NTP pyrophosphatase [Kiritimatiellae bacterium]|nr:RdgB/HAM1 family non-canonical purine NTP pyrophosphatase [Kiritimatiellia bacterium]